MYNHLSCTKTAGLVTEVASLFNLVRSMDPLLHIPSQALLRILLYVEHTLEPPPLSMFDLGALQTAVVKIVVAPHILPYTPCCGRRNIWRIPTTERLRLVMLYTSNGIIASKGFIASRAFLGRSSSRSARAQEPLPLIRRLRCMQAYCGCCACSLSFARIGIIVSSDIIDLITFLVT